MAALNFYRGKLGGGGWIMDVIWSPDGETGIIRPDVGPPWIWEPSYHVGGDYSLGAWRPLITSSSFPAPNNVLGRGGGCYGIDVSRSNSQILYGAFFGSASNNSTMYKSTDRGANWTLLSGFTPTIMTVSSSYRMYGKKMMIHPSNPDIVITTNNAGKVFRTADGGTTWAEISGLPAGLDPCVQFDWNNGNNVYLGWRTEDNRLWKSTDAGATFSQMTGGPDNIRRMTSAIDGKIFICEDALGQNTWRLVGTTFTNMSPTNGSGFSSVACSPLNADRVSVMQDAGGLATSEDGGDTFGSFPTGGIRTSTGDVPWLRWTNEDYFICGDIAYDPLIENKVWYAQGIGVWTYFPVEQSGAATDIQSITRGQEELIVNDVAHPPGGKRLISCQDRPVFRIENTTLYPNEHGPDRGAVSIRHGWSVDYASSDPNFICVAAQFGTGSFYSTNGGVTWAYFASQSPIASVGLGGCMVALTPSNLIWCPSNNGFPHYTTDGGASWTLCTFPGDVPTSGESGFGYSIYLGFKYFAADRVDSTFYAYNYLTGDMYKSVDSGANFTKTADAVQAIGNVGENMKLHTVPGNAGHLFLVQGALYTTGPLKRSTDAGATWSNVPGTNQAWAIGMSAPAPGQSYPAILLVGRCNDDTENGIYLSIDNCATWELQTRAPGGELDYVRGMAGNPDVYGDFTFGGAYGYFYTALNKQKSFGLQF